MTNAAKNTDRELWRGPDEGNGPYYADSLFVTEGGGIGMNVGGYVIVKPLRAWFALANTLSESKCVGMAFGFDRCKDKCRAPKDCSGKPLKRDVD